MKTSKTFLIASRGFILLSALSLFSVSLMAFVNPQSVMDLVHVELNNTDAFSSIRGVYGGVGLALTISLVYFMIKDVQKALSFLSLLWGFYAFSRIITIFMEGALGNFGKQWLTIETLFFFIAITLLLIQRKKMSARQVIDPRIAG
jgi:hypothetical protein